jgi:hypothetical protein
MAPKQGLNLGDTDTLLTSLGLPRKPKTFSELSSMYGQGLFSGKGPAAKTFIPPVKSMEQMYGKPKTEGMKALNFLMDIPLAALEGGRLLTGGIGALTNPAGNIVGDYLAQVTPEEFAKQTKDSVLGPGSELFLPDENRPLGGSVGAKTMADVPGMDVFTQQGQDRLTSETSKALENLIGKSVGDVGAFDPQGEVDKETVDKIKEQQQVEADKKDIAPDAFFDGDEGDGTGEDTVTDDEVEGADTPAKKATVKALDSFLSEVKTGKVKLKTFDEYINEFGEATGLDISGEADTKQALMSFGLALMQNRAGKGFNISNILGAVGEAGEAAMPDFRKATAEAKAIRAKAGSYALGKTEADKKIAMNRKPYFVIPRGDGSANSLTSMIASGKGRLTRLNSFELNNLTENPEFEKQFEVVDADFYKDYAKAAIAAAGKKKFYQSKAVDIPLFAEAPKGLSFKAQLIDGNVAPAGTAPLFIDSSKRVVGMIQNMERKVDYNAKQFEELANLLNETDVDILDQSRSAIKQTLRNFGLNIGDTDPVKKIKTIMQRLQATNAAEILQESGKTLSDADRKFVREIVGDVNFLEGDEAVLREKLSNLFNVIVKRGRENIKDAYDNLGAHGVNIDRTNITAQGTTMVKGEDNVFRFKVQGTT